MNDCAEADGGGDGYRYEVVAGEGEDIGVGEVEGCVGE